MPILKKILTNINLTKPLKMAIVVRTDLKLTKGKVAAQCSHAAIICYEKSIKSNPQLLRLWIQCGQPKVILRVPNLMKLEELHRNAVQQPEGIISELVIDAGRTEIPAGTITVLGLGPHYEDRIDQIVKHLKLL